MPHRSEPNIWITHAEVNATAEQVQRWATEDGFPGGVERCNPKTTATITGNDGESITLTDGNQWHIWKVGL